MKPRPKPQPIAYLLGLIRAGTYPWVAARAAGVSDDAFRELIDDGSPYRVEIVQAQAQSRAKAEIELKDKNPLAWLRYGPGRPSREGPGWTGAARAPSGNTDKRQAFADEVNHMMSRVNDFAMANPDLRLRLAGWIAGE